MTEVDVSELGISKNLLQMNFMRRTLVAKERAVPAPVTELLPNDEEYAFEVPETIKTHLANVAAHVRNRPRIEQEYNLFRIYRVPGGFRKSYGGFNPLLENPSKPADIRTSQTDSTVPIRNRFAELESDIHEDHKSKSSRSVSLRHTLSKLTSSEDPPAKRSRRRKSEPF